MIRRGDDTRAKDQSFPVSEAGGNVAGELEDDYPLVASGVKLGNLHVPDLLAGELNGGRISTSIEATGHPRTSPLSRIGGGGGYTGFSWSSRPEMWFQ